MATKKTNNASKSNVSKSAQLTHFKFKWWMALVLVAVIATIGIVILRFSHAGTLPSSRPNESCRAAYGVPTVTIYPGNRGGCVYYVENLINDYFRGTRGKGYNGRVMRNDTVYTNDEVVWVKQFQKERNIQADGIVGPQTWYQLTQACYQQNMCSAN